MRCWGYAEVGRATRTGNRLRSCASRMYSLLSPSEVERDPDALNLSNYGLVCSFFHAANSWTTLDRPFSKQTTWFFASFTPNTCHTPFEPKEKGEHFGTPISSLFRPLFWLPEADIHPSNLPMVVYHVSGSDTSVGTLHAILNKTKHQQYGWGESRTFSLPVQLVPSLKGAHGTCLTLVHFHSAH